MRYVVRRILGADEGMLSFRLRRFADAPALPALVPWANSPPREIKIEFIGNLLEAYGENVDSLQAKELFLRWAVYGMISWSAPLSSSRWPESEVGGSTWQAPRPSTHHRESLRSPSRRRLRNLVAHSSSRGARLRGGPRRGSAGGSRYRDPEVHWRRRRGFTRSARCS